MSLRSGEFLILLTTHAVTQQRWVRHNSTITQRRARLNKFVIEALDGALRTGAGQDEIISIVDDKSEDVKDILKYCKAEYAMIKSDYNGMQFWVYIFASIDDGIASNEILSELNIDYTSSTELAQSYYTCNYLSGNHAEAYKIFGRV